MADKEVTLETIKALFQETIEEWRSLNRDLRGLETSIRGLETDVSSQLNGLSMEMNCQSRQLTRIQGNQPSGSVLPSSQRTIRVRLPSGRTRKLPHAG